MSLTVLVVDDEPLARLGITARLRPHVDITVLGECSTGEEALKSMASLAPDLLFLDIQMPGMSGLQTFKDVPPNRRPMVIFLTAYDNYAVDAFEVQALDYLLKPVGDDRFKMALERARRLWQMKQQNATGEQVHGAAEVSNQPQSEAIRRFAVRRGSKIAFVNVADVEWIEGLGDYAGLHVGSRTHLIRESLTAMAQRLNQREFLRVHRSTIVRIDAIQRIEPLATRDYLITLQSKLTVRSSRTYSKDARKLMLNKLD